MFKFEDNNPLADNTEGFSSSYYKHLLDNSEQRDAAYIDAVTSNVEDADYVEIKDDHEPTPSKEDDPFMEEESDAKRLLNSKSSKGFSSNVDKLLSLDKVDVTNPTQVANTFKQLFKDLNEQYGLDVRFDMNSFTNTLSYIIKPKNMKALEIYISEAYSRVRATLYMLYLNAIGQLSQQILDPRFISSNSMSYSDKLILMRELFSYIQSLDEIYERVKVDQSDIKLRKLSEDTDESEDFNSDEIQNFLTNLSNSVKSNKKIEDQSS